MFKAISPFYIKSEIYFFITLNLKDFKNFSSDLHKFKLTEDEITKMKKLIEDINVLKINIAHSKSLQVPNEIYENFKKLIPVKKNLSKNEVLISDISYKNSIQGNISLRKIKDIYENKENDSISIYTVSHILKYSLQLRFLKTTKKPKTIRYNI